MESKYLRCSNIRTHLPYSNAHATNYLIAACSIDLPYALPCLTVSHLQTPIWTTNPGFRAIRVRRETVVKFELLNTVSTDTGIYRCVLGMEVIDSAVVFVNGELLAFLLG